MKNFIANWLGLHTSRYTAEKVEACARETTEERRIYYQKVIDVLHRTGSFPPNTDLKMPKASMVIKQISTSVVFAEKGRWLKLPDDNEEVIIKYASENKETEGSSTEEG